MAYIAPNTNIYLCNVPWDSTYENTPYWVTAATQSTGIAAMSVVQLTNQSYQRRGNNALRVQVTPAQAHACNYLMFRNTSYENKWFYAFVTAVDYVNNNTWDLHYEIDVLQTYLFDWTLQPCFVEREIPQADVLGQNILDEGLGIGEYVYNSYAPVGWLRSGVAFDTSVLGCMIAIVNNDAAADYNAYGSIYSAAKLYYFPQSDYSQIPAFLSMYEADPTQIIAVYMVPFSIVSFNISTHEVNSDLSALTLTFSGDTVSPGNTSLDGYVPKNKKLYCYPYNYYSVNNGSGAELKIRYEFATGNVPKLMLKSTISPPVKLNAYPVNYKGCAEYPTESISLDGFPQCLVATDAFNAWFAQNSVPMALGGAVGAVASLAGGNVAGAALGVFGTVTNFLAGAWQANLHGDITSGSLNAGNVLSAYNENQFYAGRVSINSEAAEVIDNYFSMYGYACRKIKVPSIHVRPHWSYTKTVGCQISGAIPAEDERKICSIFDNGIRWWNSASEIGDYTLDNSPV